MSEHLLLILLYVNEESNPSNVNAALQTCIKTRTISCSEWYIHILDTLFLFLPLLLIM